MVFYSYKMAYLLFELITGWIDEDGLQNVFIFFIEFPLLSDVKQSVLALVDMVPVLVVAIVFPFWVA